MTIKSALLFALLTLAFCSCLAPAKRTPAASENPPATPLDTPAQTSDAEPEDLESDGSLDSVLRLLIGPNAPVFDTTFKVIRADYDWTDRRIAGKCRSAKSLKYPGMQVVVHQYYPECPRNEPREFYGYEPARVEIKLNDVPLDPAEHRYQNSGDSVWLGWYFSGEGWEKMRFRGQDWYVHVLSNPGCNGSFCKIEATLLAKIDAGRPEFYFFEQYAQPNILADTDADGRLEWLEYSYDNWQQDTINLRITLYEWHENGRFEPMKDAEGNSREALIQFDNGLYDSRHARIMRKNWPR